MLTRLHVSMLLCSYIDILSPHTRSRNGGMEGKSGSVVVSKFSETLMCSTALGIY